MKNTNSSLYFIAGILFLIAAVAGGTWTFYPIAACMLILGFTKNKNDKKK